MLDSKYEEAKIKANAEMENVKAVSLTSDTWTSLNMDTYLAITCHYIDGSDKLSTVLLGVEKFPDNHTAENIALVKKKVYGGVGNQGKGQMPCHRCCRKK